jgi:hypothetical protein
VVALGGARIPDLVGDVDRRLRREFYGGSWRKVSGALMTSKPVRGQRHPLPGRLLNPELAARLVAARDNMSSEVKRAECQARVTLQRFDKFGIEVTPRVIAPVLQGMKTSSPNTKAQPFLPPS